MGLLLGYLEVLINFFVLMVLIWNFFGRLGVGVLLEFVLYEKGFFWFLFIMLVFMVFVFGYIILVVFFFGVLYLGIVLIGLSFGVYWLLIFIVILEFFGFKYFGILFNVVIMVSFLGLYVMFVYVVGFFYDVEL